MEPIEISLIVSILSAAATAVWTVWTWEGQKSTEREEKRERLAAFYVNPFLFAAESLQYRLFNLLYEENTLRRSNFIESTSGFLSPLTAETLYRFALYFGWENYLLRYSPYTNDPQLMDLSRRVVASFIALESFPDETFYFSLSEQQSLGQIVVEASGFQSGDIPLARSIDLYRFEEKLQEARSGDTPLWHSPGVRAAISALENFSRGESLQGKQRLEAILARLMRLIQYLEKEEGFSVVIDERFRKRLSREFPTKANGEKTAVLHRSTGRLRLRVPQVRFDENYAERLQERISSLAGITGARVDRLSSSLIVHHEISLAGEDWEMFLVSFIDREMTVDPG